MLNEYFSIDIDPVARCLQALPQPVAGYAPPLLMLPLFVLRLGTEVDWTAEQACFASIARELAFLFQVQPGFFWSAAPAADEPTLQWITQHILYPSMRLNFTVPAAHLADGALVQVACLESLYKIFERC